MRTSIWLFIAWGGAAMLMVLLPFLMGSWTGFFPIRDMARLAPTR